MDILSLVLAKGYAKVLFDRLNNVGRFLSVWDAATGLPLSFPSTTPYTYKTGDYYVVGNTSTTTNYKPDGTTYTGTASTTVETENISKLDMYYFDGTTWMVITSTTVLSAVVTSLAGSTGAIDIGNCLQMTSNSLNVKAIPYITTAPTENRANDGTLIDVVLSADPPAYYQGYRYNIFGS